MLVLRRDSRRLRRYLVIRCGRNGARGGNEDTREQQLVLITCFCLFFFSCSSRLVSSFVRYRYIIFCLCFIRLIIFFCSLFFCLALVWYCTEECFANRYVSCEFFYQSDWAVRNLASCAMDQSSHACSTFSEIIWHDDLHVGRCGGQRDITIRVRKPVLGVNHRAPRSL